MMPTTPADVPTTPADVSADTRADNPLTRVGSPGPDHPLHPDKTGPNTLPTTCRRHTRHPVGSSADDNTPPLGGVCRLSSAPCLPEEKIPPSLLVSLQAASQLLGVPATTLRDWVFRQQLPVVRVPGTRRWWFRRRDVLQLVEKHVEFWR